MRRTVGWLVSVGFGAGLVGASWAMSPAASIPSTSGIQVTVPPVTVLPGVTTPPVAVTVPPVGVTVPEATVPPVTSPVPGVTLPPVTAPALPVVTVPTVTVPPLPGVTIPSLPLPQVPATVPGGVRPDGLVECAHFLTQQAAQAALVVDARLAALLDDDADGVACELLPSGSATVPAPTGPTGAGGATAAVGPVAGGAAGGPASGATAASGSSAGASTDAVGDGGATSGGASRAGATRNGAGGSSGGGAATFHIAGDTVAAERAMEVPEADAGHLVLHVLAFVLLLGAAGGLARELAGRRGAARA